MNYSSINKQTREKNPLIKFTNQDEFFWDESVIVTELPSAKLFEIFYQKDKGYIFSSDSKHRSKNDSQIGKFLEKYIYDKLDIIVEKFSHLDIHFYGYINKKGFYGIDIFINENWIDWDFTKDLYTAAKVKTPQTLFEGSFVDFDADTHKNFIIRSEIEYPKQRSIFYKETIKTNSLTK